MFPRRAPERDIKRNKRGPASFSFSFFFFLFPFQKRPPPCHREKQKGHEHKAVARAEEEGQLPAWRQPTGIIPSQRAVHSIQIVHVSHPFCLPFLAHEHTLRER